MALLLAIFGLSGCSGMFDTSGWFEKPLDVFGSKRGYSYSNLDQVKQERPITANDLVDARGACPRMAATPGAQVAAANSSPDAAVSPDVATLIRDEVALGMSECDVVGRLGQPTGINFGANGPGERSVVLTYQSGPRPGVYRFRRGRLTEMDRVEQPPAPPEPAKKKVTKRKKKPPPQQQQHSGDNG
jgi:hypothetical protein